MSVDNPPAEHAAEDTITLTLEVDVSGMDNPSREALAELATLYRDGFEEICAKNRDYSWSFIRSAADLARTPAYPIDDSTRAMADGLLHRTGDKRQRIIENLYGDGDASVSDPAWQTAQECANYWQFMAFVLRRPEIAHEVLSP